MLPPILHLDDRLLVVDKPTGVLSVPGIGPEKADCVISRVQATYPEARIVHRLDRDTSGVLVMARDAEAHREALAAIEEEFGGARLWWLSGRWATRVCLEKC